MRTDVQLQKAVQEELTFEPSIVATDIGVTVRKGVVTLFGTVPNLTSKWAAERAAEKVTGIRALAKDLTVQLPGENRRSDADIAEAALHALRWDVDVPDQRITVEVENGLVTLKGEVDWYFQRAAAEANVRKLTGVVGVSNFITIKPSVTAKAIRAKIESALQRRAVKDARSISVEVDGGEVTLRGDVHCWAERENAELAAWAAEGVCQVNDEIRVHG